MLLAAPAVAAGDVDPTAGPLVSSICRQLYSGSSPFATDPELRVFLTDLVAPYGLSLREDLIEAGVGQSYGEMTEPVLRATIGIDAPPDLLVVSHSMPDVVPGRATANYLSHVCPGDSAAFAVCDQGLAAPFTAVAVARSYLESGAATRALVLVAEQAVLHYDPGEGVALPQRHSAVAFMLDAGAAEGVRVTQPTLRADIGPDQVAAAFAEELAGRAGDAGDAVLILGSALADRVTVPPGWRRPLVPPPGHHSTGVWWELAGGLTTWAAAGRPVFVADYEPALRYLCVLRLGPAFG